MDKGIYLTDPNRPGLVCRCRESQLQAHLDGGYEIQATEPKKEPAPVVAKKKVVRRRKVK